MLKSWKLWLPILIIGIVAIVLLWPSGEKEEVVSKPPLILNLTTNTGNNQRMDICNILTKDLKKVGIKVNYKPQEFNSLVGDLTGGRYEAVVIGLTGGIEPHTGSNVYKTTGGLHFWHWEAQSHPFEWEKKVEKSFLEGAFTMDMEEAKEAYKEFQRIFTKQLPFIYTVNQQYLYAISEDIKNTQDFSPLGSVLSFAEILWRSGSKMKLNETAKEDYKVADKESGLKHIPKENNQGKPNKITLATTSLPKTLNMLVAQETSSTDITGLIMGEGLTTRNDVTGEIEPGLAKDWHITPNDDGTVTIYFYLRKGLKWNDGEPFTAEDVVFTYYDLIFNNAVNTDIRAMLKIDGEPIKLEKSSKYVIKVTLPKPFRPALSTLGFTIMPKHVLADKVHKLNSGVPKGTFNKTWGPDTKPSKIVGMGPFKLKILEQGQKVTLVKNPYYWKVDKQGDRLPYLHTVEFLKVEDQNVMQLKFEQGDVDALAPKPENWSDIVDMADKKGWKTIKDGPTFGTNFLVFNQSYGMAKEEMTDQEKAKRKLFQNRKFRKAIAHIVDKETIINNIYHGLAIPQWSPVSIPSPFFDDSESFYRYPYDLEKARELLDEVGLRDTDGDGWREFTEL